MMDQFVGSLKEHLIRQLSEFPFHNLKLLTGYDASIGGTCFDHALRLRRSLQEKGYFAKLHEAEVCMTGKLTHRLVKVTFQDKDYFVDTGTGFPTCYVAEPNSHTRNYDIAGVFFQVVSQKKIILIRRHNGEKWLNMSRISVEEQDEEAILRKFNKRYSENLPFSNELRMCWLEGKCFYRVVGMKLSVYESGRAVIQNSLSSFDLLRRIERTAFPELVINLQSYLEGKW